MNEKLIFFDIDNTLVSHASKGRIPEPTALAVGLLKEAGHTVAVATARNRSMTLPTTARLGIDLLVCCGGAHVSLDGKVLREEYLSASFLRAFTGHIASNPDDCWALDAEYVYIARNDPALTDYIVAQAAFDCRRPPGELRRACMACTLSGAIFQNEKTRWKAEVSPTPYGAEYLPPGVDKWSGILCASEKLGFSVEDIITVGDGDNDAEMLRNAPLGIAVAKATEAALEAADLVTSDIDEGGIMEAFLRLGMIRPSQAKSATKTKL